MALSLALTLVLGAKAQADPGAVDRFQPEPFRLDDRFEDNTLEDYNTAGGVAWSTMKLSLRPQAAIALVKTLDPKLKLNLDLWSDPPEEGKPSVTQLLVKTTNGYGFLVNLARGMNGGRVIRQASVAMLRRKPGAGSQHEIVPLPQLPAFRMAGEREEWSLDYNYGLLTLRCGKQTLGSVYVDAFSGWVTAIQVKQVTGKAELTRFAVNGRTTGYSDWQREQYNAINKMRAEVDKLFAEGNYLAVIDLNKRIIAKGEHAFGEDDTSIALFLSNLATSQMAVRLNEESLKNHDRAVEITSGNLSADHPQALLHRIAAAEARVRVEGPSYLLVKEMRDAIFRYQKLAGVDKQGVFLARYAGAAYEEATRLNGVGSGQEALRVLQDVLELTRGSREEGHPDITSCEATIALQKRFIDSEGEERRRLGKYFRLREENRLAVRAGNEPHAILTRAELADQCRLVFGKNDARLVDHLLANGSDLLNAGRIGEALAVLHEAGNLLDATPTEQRNKGNEISCRIMLASAYSQLGRYDDANALFIEAEKLLNEHGINDKISWAVFHLKTGRHFLDYGLDDAALPRLGEAVRVFYAAALYTSRGALESLELFGETLRKLGKLEDSEQCAQQLRYVIEATFGEESHAMAKVLKLEGNLRFERKDYAGALEKYGRAYDLLVEFGRDRSQTMLEVLAGQIEAHLQRRDIPAAVACFEQKLAYELEYRESAYDATSEGAQALKSQQDLASLDSLLILALEGHLSAERAYSHALAFKGSVTARQRALRVLLQSPELKPLADELAQIELQLAASAESAETGAGVEELTALQNRRSEIGARLAAANRSYRLAARRYDADDLKGALPADAVLVDYVEYIKPRGIFEKLFGQVPKLGLAAFVITPDGEVKLFDLGKVDSAYDELVAWRTTMAAEPLYAAAGRGAEARANLNTWGQMLRKRIVDPFAKSLAGVRTVIISPSLHLSECPFGALPIGDTEEETFLIERFALTRIATPRLLPELLLAKPKASRGGLLIAGDIDYGKPQQKDQIVFRQLEQDEVDTDPIREAYTAKHNDRSVTLLSGAEATESRVRDAAAKHAWLHFNTHGFSIPLDVQFDSPADEKQSKKQKKAQREEGPSPYVITISGIALAGGNALPYQGAPMDDNGILVAEEIVALGLADAELVTLSACQTALGDQLPGEGLLGAQRALHIAGAKSSLTSLWSVDSLSTRELMVGFYDALWRKEQPKAAALQQTMKRMIRDYPWQVEEGKPYDSRTPPALWAGFVLHGDWR